MVGACNDQDSLQCIVHLKYSSISHLIQSSLKLMMMLSCLKTDYLKMVRIALVNLAIWDCFTEHCQTSLLCMVWYIQTFYLSTLSVLYNKDVYAKVRIRIRKNVILHRF